MGTRGPIPSRSDDLARPRERKGSDQMPVTTGEARGATWPEADPMWHQLAIDLYDSARISGQADFYEQSDVAMLRSLCDDLSYAKNSYQRSGQMLQTIYSTMSSLLLTEGDRRRVRVELEKPKQEEDSAAVLAIANYREALAGSEE